MQQVIQTIATFLSITQFDVYVLAAFLVILLIFALSGIQKIYEIFFGLVLGIGIFIVLQVLFSPQYQTPETAKFINETVMKLVVGSAVYLVFILSVLMPINGWLAISYSKDPIYKGVQTVLLSIALFIFYLTVLFGFIERAYIFNIENAFSLIKNTALFNEGMKASLFYSFTVGHIQVIVILGVLFMIYKLLFGDIVHAMVMSLISSIMKKRSAQWGGGGHHEEVEDHLEDFMMEDDHHDHGHDHWHGHGHH